MRRIKRIRKSLHHCRSVGCVVTDLSAIATLWLGADGNNTDRAHWDQLIEDLLMAQAQVSLRLAAAM
jgi:hypothetical protein